MSDWIWKICLSPFLGQHSPFSFSMWDTRRNDLIRIIPPIVVVNKMKMMMTRNKCLSFPSYPPPYPSRSCLVDLIVNKLTKFQHKSHFSQVIIRNRIKYIHTHRHFVSVCVCLSICKSVKCDIALAQKITALPFLEVLALDFLLLLWLWFVFMKILATCWWVRLVYEEEKKKRS